MPPVTLAAFRKQIAAGAMPPVYVLVGEDEIGKAEALDAILDTVDEGLRAFNVDRLDASAATNVSAREELAARLLSAARTLPMMAARRIVILRRADALLFPKAKKDDEDGEAEPARPAKKGAAAEDPLEQYIGSPEPETTLVVVLDSLPQNRRIGKMLWAQAAVVSFGTEVDEADAVHWIEAQARHAKVAFEPAAVRTLVARAGTNIVRLRAGVERVLLYAMGQPTITAEDVRQAVPASPDAPENFGIANAIRRNDVADALRELALALDAGSVPFYLLGQLRSAAEQLPPARLRAGVEAVFRTDLALKSSAGDPRVLLERLVVELCAAGRGAARR